MRALDFVCRLDEDDSGDGAGDWGGGGAPNHGVGHGGGGMPGPGNWPTHTPPTGGTEGHGGRHQPQLPRPRGPVPTADPGDPDPDPIPPIPPTPPTGTGGHHRKPPTPNRPSSGRTLSQVATGATIPVNYGREPVGGNIIRAKVFGSYFFIAFAIGEGPINAVKRILIDGRDIGTTTIQGRVGLGLVENTDYYIHLGGKDQTYDPFLHMLNPAHVTGWPGLAYAVIRFRPPTQRIGQFDPTRAVFDIEGKLTRDMRLHQPHKDPLKATGAGGSGNPNGVYYYKYTNATADWESAGSPPSNKVTASNEPVTLDDIWIDSEGIATSRKVYRTKDGAGSEGPYYYVLTVADNTTEDGITDNVADADLGDEIPAVQTEYTYSTNGILHRYDLMTNVTFGGGIKEKYVDGGFEKTFSEAADDCDEALVLPAPPASAPTLSQVIAQSVLPAGTYYYTYTNVDSAGIESLESASASLLIGSFRRIKLSSIEVSGGSIVKHRIYRSDPNGGANGSRHMVDEIADGVTTYTDNTLPESLGVSAPTQAVRYQMSISLRDTRSLQEWIDVFDQHYMGYGVYNSGVFQAFIDKMKPACGLVFTDIGTDANMTDLSVVSLKGSSNSPNVITVQFTDASRDYTDGFASAETQSVTDRTEDKREKRYSLPGITSYDQAKRMAIHLLNLQHFADKTVSFNATPEAIRLLPGDIIEVTSQTGFASALVLVREVEPLNGGMRYRVSGDFYSDDTYSDAVQQGTVKVPTLYPDPHVAPPSPPAEPYWYRGDPNVIPLIYWDPPRVYRPTEQVQYTTGFWTATNLGSYDGTKVNDGDIENPAFVSNSGARNLELDLGSGQFAEFGRCIIHYQDPLTADDDARMGYTFDPDTNNATGIEYSDNGSVWTGVTALTRKEGGLAGDRHTMVEWMAPGAHRYWRVTPGTTFAGPPDDANSPVYTEVQFETFEDYPYVDHYDIYDMRSTDTPSAGIDNIKIPGTIWKSVPADARPTADDGLDASDIASGTYMFFWVFTVNKAKIVSEVPCVFDRARPTFGGYGRDFSVVGEDGVTDFIDVPTIASGPMFLGRDWYDVTLVNGANDDVDISAADTLVRITGPSAAFSITGLVPPSSIIATRLTIQNLTDQDMTLKHADAGSADGNRIICPGFTDLTLTGDGQSVTLVFDPNGGSAPYGAWYVTAHEPASTGGGGGGGSTISFGAYGSRPSGSDGDLYKATDNPIQSIKDSGVWQDFFEGWPITKIDNSAFSWTAQGTSSITDMGALFFRSRGTGAFHIRKKAAPTPPYSIVLKLRPMIPASDLLQNYNQWCLGWREASSGKLDVLTLQHNSGVVGATGYCLSRDKYNDETSYNGNLAFDIAPANEYIAQGFYPFMVFKIEDDNTNRIVSYSLDAGASFTVLDSRARTTFFTPDQVWFGMGQFGSQSIDGLFISWEES